MSTRWLHLGKALYNVRNIECIRHVVGPPSMFNMMLTSGNILRVCEKSKEDYAALQCFYLKQCKPTTSDNYERMKEELQIKHKMNIDHIERETNLVTISFRGSNILEFSADSQFDYKLEHISEALTLKLLLEEEFPYEVGEFRKVNDGFEVLLGGKWMSYSEHYIKELKEKISLI